MRVLNTFVPTDLQPKDEFPPSQEHPLKLVILGATGSIGTQTLDVVRAHKESVVLKAIAVNTSVEKAVSIAKEFNVSYIAIADEGLKNHPSLDELDPSCTVLFGSQAVVSLCELEDINCVLNALVGQAGMRASYTSLKNNKRLALANKESLVVAGDLIMPLAKPGLLLPVDSEHGAIFQCLIGEDSKNISKIWLTASGGPFFGKNREELKTVTRADALKHPTWSMGSKITIDSATLMNKGLEVLEAMHLFEVGVDSIEVVVHRQSIVHSMVEYVDGSVKAHMGNPDMRIPIQFALSYPDRWENVGQPPSFFDYDDLTFQKPDIETFRCLKLALQAGNEGGTLPAVLNAANEIAVAAFLNEEISFTNIDEVVQATMDAHTKDKVISLDQLDEIDRASRAFANTYISQNIL